MTTIEFERLKRRLDFSYNGDLGALQHKTQTWYEALEQIESLGWITREQFKELAQTLIEHFKKGLQDAINNPHYYIR